MIRQSETVKELLKREPHLIRLQDCNYIERNQRLTLMSRKSAYVLPTVPSGNFLRMDKSTVRVLMRGRWARMREPSSVLSMRSKQCSRALSPVVSPKQAIISPRYGFKNDTNPEPAVSSTRCMLVSGTCCFA